jgi:hypothetical protein
MAMSKLFFTLCMYISNSPRFNGTYIVGVMQRINGITLILNVEEVSIVFVFLKFYLPVTEIFLSWVIPDQQPLSKHDSSGQSYSYSVTKIHTQLLLVLTSNVFFAF